MTDWTYNNFLGNSKKVTPMKYNEPFTMNDEQLARFKAGKKVFSEGKCDVVPSNIFMTMKERTEYIMTVHAGVLKRLADDAEGPPSIKEEEYVHRPWGTST